MNGYIISKEKELLDGSARRKNALCVRRNYNATQQVTWITTTMENGRATFDLSYSPSTDIHWFQVHQTSPSCISFSPTGKYLASGGKDGVLAIWSLSIAKAQYIFRGDIAITCIKWSSPTTFLFGRQDGTVCYGEIGKVASTLLFQSCRNA
jgi:WD40 repeat protein